MGRTRTEVHDGLDSKISKEEREILASFGIVEEPSYQEDVPPSVEN